ncbi:DUF6438 domain-containing protein [Luteibacter aegosomaticola]|uniref:DUF6438 domain-containing protein n=1 Tax=Luteibacter aegosomaticola TaxID=2911538 RepID=UPI001FF82FFE|nr:DUF6438 domain-containing protein [Luteibacter aegosomaticola]UPG91762.1 DUF6438 domain-containing protein [Luteibacter aegosomaticola]
MRHGYLGYLGFALAMACPSCGIAAEAKAPAHPAAATTITLERSMCYGACPAYKVTIHGDGRVHYEGEPGGPPRAAQQPGDFGPGYTVVVGGSHDDRIPSTEISVLLARFRDAGFWDLNDEYKAAVTDVPTYTVTLSNGSRTKSVVDFMGSEVGMPASVTALQDAIDKAAHTDRWTKGTAELIPWLERNGFDFHSDTAAQMAVAAEKRFADEGLVTALIDRGAPLETPVSDDSAFQETSPEGELAGLTLLKVSLRRGHAQVFNRLVDRDWLGRWDRVEAGREFARRSAGCSPAMVDAAVAAGIPVDAVTIALPAYSSTDVGGATALASLRSDYACYREDGARIPTVRALLERGADPNHRDDEGRPPLWGVESMEFVDLLLAHGADATITDNRGNSLIFGASNEEVVLRLLEAGASVQGRDSQGRSLAARMAESPMPQVAAWLSAHPEASQK